MSTTLRLEGVGVRRGPTWLLDAVDWSVDEGERWIVMGPNGAGKTTLLSVASGRLFPTRGRVELLGEELGAVDLAELRPRIGWASSAMSSDLPPQEAVSDAVITGAWAVSGRWREAYSAEDAHRAQVLMDQWGLSAHASRTFGTLSEGERKRTLIARSLMADPELLLLDEPGAGLDLGGREDLVARMGALAADPCAPTQVLVTHHVEEIPPGFTHALLLAHGRVVVQGPLHEVMTDSWLSCAFDQPIQVRGDDGRWFARRRTPGEPGSPPWR